MNNINDKLMEVRKWKADFQATLEAKLTLLRAEKTETIVAYDEEIAGLEMELRGLGVAVQSFRPNETTIKAYNFLLENPGKRYRSIEIMTAIRCVGAMAFRGDHLRDAQSQLDAARRKGKDKPPADSTAA